MRTLEIDGRTVEYDIGCTSVGYVVSMDARADAFPFPRVGDVERVGRKWRAVVGPTSSGFDYYARAADAPVFRTMRQAVEYVVRAATPTDDARLTEVQHRNQSGDWRACEGCGLEAVQSPGGYCVGCQVARADRQTIDLMPTVTPTIEDLRAVRALMADAPGTVNCSLVRFDHELDTLKVKCGSLQVSTWALNALKSAGYEVTRANKSTDLRAIYYVDPPSTGHPTEQDPPLSYADHRAYAVPMPISDDRLDRYSRRGVLISRDAAHEVVASLSRDRHELLSRGGEANVEAAELLDSLRRRIMEAMR